MKNILFAIALFSSNLITGQTYHFNIVSIYELTDSSTKSEEVVLSNSDDQSYFLQLYDNVAYLFDVNRRYRHDFTLRKTNVHKPELLYKKSIRLDKTNIASEYSFKFETMEEDSIHKTIKMTRWKNNQALSPGYIELKAKKISKNLFPLYRFTCMHLYESRHDINIPENLVILSSRFVGGKSYDWLLISVEDTKFDVIIK